MASVLITASLFLKALLCLWKKRITVTGIYIFFYLCCAVSWGLGDQMPRFISVIIPFLWIVVLEKTGARTAPARKSSRLSLALWLFLPLAALPANIQALRGLHTIRHQHLLAVSMQDLWAEYTATIESLKSGTSSQAILGAKNDQIFYLYTGRKAFPLVYPEKLSDRDTIFTDLIETVQKNNIYILVMEPEFQAYIVHSPVNRAIADIIQHYPELITRLYMSPAGKLSIYLYNPRQEPLAPGGD